MTALAMGGAMVLAGCAVGSQDDHRLQSGTYELLTTEVSGECVIDGGISAGTEHSGKVVRAELEANEHAVSLTPCDPFFDDMCAPQPFAEPISLLRDGSDLSAGNDAWEVPDCTCFESVRGSRHIDGLVVADNEIELTWSFELPDAPDNCLCEVTACTGTVTQRVLRKP